MRKSERRLELLTPAEKRTRQIRKAVEADMAAWQQIGGRVEWERELCRRRKARNERTRAHTREVMAAKRTAAAEAAAAELQPGLWDVA